MKEALTKYGFSVEMKDEKRMHIKSEDLNLTTPSGKAVFVTEDGKLLSLCSGPTCEDKLKVFFKIKSLD